MKKIVLTGGGEDSHIFPLIAIAKGLKKQYPNSEIYFIGASKGFENKLIKNGDVFNAKVNLNIKKIKQKFNLYNPFVLISFIFSYFKSRKILKNINPDLVIGFGGFISAPIVYAAYKLKIKTLIHEQNSQIGRANKFLCQKVDTVCVSFERTKSFLHRDDVYFTGNPRMTEFTELSKNVKYIDCGIPKSIKSVLIVGGSKNAESINEAFIEAHSLFIKADFFTTFVTGYAHYNDVSKILSAHVSHLRYQIIPYIEDMPSILKLVDLVVCRPGPTNIAEMASIGKPLIVIPAPNALDNYQLNNAKVLVNKDAAILLEEKNLTGRALYRMIESTLKNDALLKSLSKNIKQISKADSLFKILNLINELLEEKANIEI